MCWRVGFDPPDLAAFVPLRLGSGDLLEEGTPAIRLDVVVVGWAGGGPVRPALRTASAMSRGTPPLLRGAMMGGAGVRVALPLPLMSVVIIVADVDVEVEVEVVAGMGAEEDLIVEVVTPDGAEGV